ncbi:MAG: hypothetical protein FWC76_05035 [Defluviitaleaceae bacterium]|nr:hypothetical protein [Defluviitaleaceae bacterium]
MFHLKALEYAKKHVNTEIRNYKYDIWHLGDEISSLEASIAAGPSVAKPSMWYFPRWSGKWFIFLMLSVAAAVVILDDPLLLMASCAALAAISIIGICISYSKNQRILRHHNEEVWRIDEEVKQKEDFGVILEEVSQKLGEMQNILSNIKISRSGLYSINYIPYQYRNLEAIGFFYSQVKSSPITLKELMLFEPQRVNNGYEDIPNFIKILDETYSFPTVNKAEFWSSCGALMREIEKYLAMEGEQGLEQSIQGLIRTIESGGLGVKYEIKGNVGSIVEKQDGILLNYLPTIKSEVDHEVLERFIEEIKREIVNCNAENHQETLRKTEELKPELAREEFESDEDWKERTERRIRETLGDFADIASIASAIGFFFG